MSHLWFERTEMDVLPLRRKVEYFLERMFKLADIELTRQETVIAEFSDSDPEY